MGPVGATARPRRRHPSQDRRLHVRLLLALLHWSKIDAHCARPPYTTTTTLSLHTPAGTLSHTPAAPLAGTRLPRTSTFWSTGTPTTRERCYSSGQCSTERPVCLLSDCCTGLMLPTTRCCLLVTGSPCSGHGFKFSAGLGECCAALLAGDAKPPLDLSLFRSQATPPPHPPPHESRLHLAGVLLETCAFADLPFSSCSQLSAAR